MFYCQVCRKLSAPREKVSRLTTVLRQKQDEETGKPLGTEIAKEINAHQKCADVAPPPAFAAPKLVKVPAPRVARSNRRDEDGEDD